MPDRPRPVQQQVAQLLRSVPGSRQRPQGQPAQVQILAAAQLLMRERQPRPGGGKQPCAKPGQLPHAFIWDAVGGEGELVVVYDEKPIDEIFFASSLMVASLAVGDLE